MVGAYAIIEVLIVVCCNLLSIKIKYHIIPSIGQSHKFTINYSMEDNPFGGVDPVLTANC